MLIYNEAINFLNQFQFHGYKLGLQRIYKALKYFGNPHKKLNFIHVAGTNGKGSVCATLSSILTKAGYKTGLYTSPHLIKLNERFRFCEQDILDHELVELIHDAKKIIDKGFELSYFEITTLISILWFYKKNCDICVFETGLGGRLDATNIVRPVITAITSISYDHKKYLGETIEEIAAEKAGILKRGVPSIIGTRNPNALKVIEKRAKTLEIETRYIDKDFKVVKDKQNLTYAGWKKCINGINYNLIGRHQEDNLAISLAICEKLNESGLKLSDKDILDGCKLVKWPCRCELIEVARLKILIDGAHNLDGIGALREFLALYLRDKNFQRRILIFGCTDDGQDDPRHSKDIGKMLVLLLQYFDITYITTPPNARHSISIEKWKSEITRLGLEKYKIKLIEDYESCYKAIKDEIKEESFLCICGSLYLCGILREKFINQNYTSNAAPIAFPTS